MSSAIWHTGGNGRRRGSKGAELTYLKTPCWFKQKRGVRICYNGSVPVYYMGDTWTVDNTNVASVDGLGSAADVTAIGYGSANFIGHWEVYSYTMVYDFESGGKHCEASSGITEPEAPVAVKPSISGPHTMWWFNGETPSGHSNIVSPVP
jgi:hypothetical protein